ncbi:MAG: LPS-assembly protein LptD [Rhodobacterales bacterium]|nr:LPS-assembly protein LptD [Rhodobacterales bacterium]
MARRILPTVSRLAVFRLAVSRLAGALLVGLALAAPPGRAQSPDLPINRDEPVQFTADSMSHDRELGIVTASGNVQVDHAGRVLFADTISYNQRQDVMTATGNISLLEPTGEVIFGQHMELTGDLKDGIVTDLRMILSDGARVAANGGRLSAGKRTEFRKAVYSPCNLCADDPDRPPLWQVKAVKVTHDRDRRIIEYADAWLEVAGVPVAYTPYLVHPDPTVKRQTGFLAPSAGGSTDLGFTVRTPFFLNLGDDKDATITPILTTKERAILAGEYRQRFQTGSFDGDASITYDSTDEWRGHLRSETRFDLNRTWRTGLDLNRATDDTYMRRYGFGDDSTLTSRAYVEGFRGRNYLVANAYSFQGLEATDDPGQTPFVLPMVDYNHVGQPDRLGGRTHMDAGLVALTRTDGTDTRRLSLGGGWRLPMLTSWGGAFTFNADLRGDLYHVNGHKIPGQPGSNNGFEGRLHPSASLDWRQPFVRSGARFQQVLEPRAAVVVSPYGGNPADIPNEDSQDFEFDDTNLFSENRFPGLDRVEGGPRVNYGVRWGLYDRGHRLVNAFVGQSYRVRDDSTFAVGTGLEDNLSDIVGTVEVSPDETLNLFYRTRLTESLTPRRNEISIAAGVPLLRASASYVFFDPKAGSEVTGREEVSFSVSSQINRHWRTGLTGLRDLSDNGGQRYFGAQLVYEDECFTFTASARRTFFIDRDLKPNDSIVFRLLFKTLGEVSSGFSLDGS